MANATGQKRPRPSDSSDSEPNLVYSSPSRPRLRLSKLSLERRFACELMPIKPTPVSLAGLNCWRNTQLKALLYKGSSGGNPCYYCQYRWHYCALEGTASEERYLERKSDQSRRGRRSICGEVIQRYCGLAGFQSPPSGDKPNGKKQKSGNDGR